MKLIIALALFAVSASTQVAQPDPKLTPGAIDPAVTQANIGATICVTGYTIRVRNVPESLKRRVFEEYGIDPKESAKYEIDHRVSLENGGSNDIRNLWPQPYNPRPGAHEKDVLETYLKRQVCSGKMSLADDQKILKGDWYAAYKRFGLGK